MLDDHVFTCAPYKKAANDPVQAPPMFPLPAINNQPPVLLVFDHTEMAIDLAYERHYVPGGPLVRSATRESTLYWIPRLTPAFVVAAGTVVYAKQQTSGGHMIIVDHENGWLTLYGGIEHMFVPPTDRLPRREVKLKAGDILGYLGASKGGPLRPLHFELWRQSRLQDYDQIDPIRHMRRWYQVAWNDSKLDHTPRVA